MEAIERNSADCLERGETNLTKLECELLKTVIQTESANDFLSESVCHSHANQSRAAKESLFGGQGLGLAAALVMLRRRIIPCNVIVRSLFRTRLRNNPVPKIKIIH